MSNNPDPRPLAADDGPAAEALADSLCGGLASLAISHPHFAIHHDRALRVRAALLAAQTLVCELETEVKKWRAIGGPERTRTVTAVLTHERASEVRFLATDTELFDWWFRNGLTEDITDEGATVWWADSVAEEERVTVGANIRDAIGKAMRGIYDVEPLASTPAAGGGTEGDA